MQLPEHDITEQIIGAAFEVHNQLGYGFLEKVYQRAMKVELEARGISAEIETEIRVVYKGVEVGYYKADILVAGRVLVELKVASEFRRRTTTTQRNSRRPESGSAY